MSPHFGENKNTLYQVNDDIFAKLSSPFCCNLADMHNSFWIVSVYMKNRRIYNLTKKETIEQTTRNKFIQVVLLGMFCLGSNAGKLSVCDQNAFLW